MDEWTFETMMEQLQLLSTTQASLISEHLALHHSTPPTNDIISDEEWSRLSQAFHHQAVSIPETQRFQSKKGL